MATPLKLLVFDFDGTIINSKSDITTAVNLTLGDFGLPPMNSCEIQDHIGTGVRPLIESKLKAVGISDIPKVMAAFDRHYLDHLVDETRLYPGVDAALWGTDFVKVVLTNKMNKFLTPLLKALKIADAFGGAYGRESFSTCKPDPGPLFEIARIHGVLPAQILMIGDTDVDMLAGQRAGTKTCAVTYGFGHSLSLLKCNPSIVVNSPSELGKYLEEIENE